MSINVRHIVANYAASLRGKSMRFHTLCIALLFAATAPALPCLAQSATATTDGATTNAAIPALMHHTGVALLSDGKPLKGEASITFLIFEAERGGDPVWAETQSVKLDAGGNYDVQLGAASTSGLPASLFSSGEARWLEVQVAGGAPQPRLLLTSVPYAMKAADAVTLGGLPASDFVTQNQLAQLNGRATQASSTTSAIRPLASGTLIGSGTTGTVPLWTGAFTQGNSEITQVGSEIGINETVPAATLDVGGTTMFRGTATLPAESTATASGGFRSQLLGFTDSAWSTTTKAPIAQTWRLYAIDHSNDTASPTSTLSFQFQNGAGAATPTVLSIEQTGVIDFAPTQTFPGAITSVTGTSPLTAATTSGAVSLDLNTSALETTLNTTYAQLATANKFTAPTTFGAPVTFAAGQTFPGSGTITGVTTTSPLTGSGTTGSVALGLNLTALQTSLNASYAQLNAVNKFTQPITFATGQTFPGTGTITAVTAGTGLTGGGTTGSVKLSLDPSVIPTLSGSPVFTSPADGIQGITNANYVNSAGVQGQAGSPSGLGGGISGVWGDAYAHVGVLGTSNEYSGVQGVSTNSYGVQGSSTSNTAVLGTSTSGTGVSGLSTSNSGVAGYTAGTTYNTAGVNGKAGAVSGITQVNAGVWGDSYQQVGVEGTSNQSDGVYGQSTGFNGVVGVSSVAIGVAGNSTSGTGMAGSSNTGAGMVGYTGGTVLNTGGVIGIAGPRTSFSGISGIWGDAANHVGVQGTSNIYTGVQGSSVSGPGVQGNSTSGNGMHGVSANTSGIFGETSSTSGGDAALYGYSHNNAIGVFGFSPKFGVIGESGGNSAVGGETSVFINGPAAVWGDTSGAGYAVAGTTDNGVAGQFINSSASQEAMYVGNFYNGNSTVATLTGEAGGCTFFGNGDVLCEGKISSAVTLRDGEHAVKTYSVQSAENWYEDAGSAQLVNGVVRVRLDPTFSETVNTEIEYHVFLTPNGDSEGLYVSNKTSSGFEVHEQHGGHSNIAFDYRIMAKRAGHENERLEDVTDHMKKQMENRARMLRADKAAPATAEAAR